MFSKKKSENDELVGVVDRLEDVEVEFLFERSKRIGVICVGWVSFDDRDWFSSFNGIVIDPSVSIVKRDGGFVFEGKRSVKKPASRGDDKSTCFNVWAGCLKLNGE